MDRAELVARLRQEAQASEDLDPTNSSVPVMREAADLIGIAYEANKLSLMALCVLLRHVNATMHPNTVKDVEFAIEANRAAIAKATTP